jgi:stage III sporulation protein AH
MVVFRKSRLITLTMTVVLCAAALVLAVAQEQGALKYLLTWDAQPSGSAATGSGSGSGSSGGSGEPATGTGSGQAPGGGTTGVAPEPDFFTDFRLDRERARGEQLEYLREAINNTKLDEATRKQAGEQWLAITRQVGKELELEGLIKAKGWDDCIVFVQDTSCTVVVKAEKLTQAQVAQIGDIVVRGTGLNAKAVNIVSRPR